MIAHFDPEQVSLATLIEIHLRTHASTSNHTMRGKYRSAVYAFDKAQQEQAQAILDNLQEQFDEPLVTRALPYRSFKPSDERFQEYFKKNAGGPFCKAYIDPKLQLLMRDFEENIKPAAS